MSKWRRQGAPAIDDVAGNGLINRRALLGRGIAIAGTVGATAAVTSAAAEPLTDAPWSLQFGQNTPPVQTPSPFEKDVTRALSNPNGEFRNSHARTPHHLLGGTVTRRRTGYTSPLIIAASRTSIRLNTNSSFMEWCANHSNSR
jgi:sulfane dehydrogenase subunit SoxC